jgi:heme exporter protein D
MSELKDHEELFELLPSAALGILDGEELQLVLSHVGTCAACSRQLSGYREAAALMALNLPSRPMSRERAADVKSRLLLRAGAGGRASGQLSVRGRWAGWLVAAGLAGVLLVHHSIHRPVAYGWLAAGLLTLALIALAMYAIRQRDRVAAMHQRLSLLEQRNTEPNEKPRRS